MIKKIHVEQLKVGMYVSNLDAEWMEHSFLSPRFKVTDPSVIARILNDGIKHVYIDTAKGPDVEDAPPVEAVARETERVMEAIAREPVKVQRVATVDERKRASGIYSETSAAIRNLMRDARVGKRIEVKAIEPLAERMVASIQRSAHALTSVTRIKNKDEYTYMHPVSVAAITIAFARFLEIPDEEIFEIARGALLHDIGKIVVPSALLNKPGKLSHEEFELMRQHVARSEELLSEIGFSEKSLEAVTMHHERIDGTGYPRGLKGAQISLVGQISALVDVYDALTSMRSYQNAWEPSYTLKKMLEWSPDHFDPELVQKFIRCLGIYPVGSVVELDSGLVGIVTEQGHDLLRPQLLIVYNGKKRHFLMPRTVDLEKDWDNRIVKIGAPDQYGINVADFV